MNVEMNSVTGIPTLSNYFSNNIAINPDQKKELILDKGDRLITIANFNNLETVNHSQWLHIL